MKKHPLRWVIVAVVLVLFIAAAAYIINGYHVRDIYVDGNVHYTDEEIAALVLDSKLSYNSLYLSLKYRNKSISGVPFIEKMDVDVLTPTSVRINVYEKALAGYIAYLDRYLYFDREGILVESAQVTTAGIPEVSGLDFSHAVLYEKLPVDNDDVFATILELTQALHKYELDADRIYFDSAYEIYLYFDEVEVSFGSKEDMEDKMARLKEILPTVEGSSGILKIRDYDRNTNNITFEGIQK